MSHGRPTVDTMRGPTKQMVAAVCQAWDQYLRGRLLVVTEGQADCPSGDDGYVIHDESHVCPRHAHATPTQLLVYRQSGVCDGRVPCA